MALHEQSVGKTDEWYTPSYVFEAMGTRFDMDVASPGPKVTPWIPADTFIRQESLLQVWKGFIWMNPPFGARNGLVPWLNKFILHRNGIALVPDRTSAPWWQEFARAMDVVLFVDGKIKFIDRHGKTGKSPAQGTCLFGLGDRAKTVLLNAEAEGLGFLMKPAR